MLRRERATLTESGRIGKHRKHSGGCIGKHRKHSGGRGNAGGQHHHRINFDKYRPGYLGTAATAITATGDTRRSGNYVKLKE